jgi:hypothetical protein
VDTVISSGALRDQCRRIAGFLCGDQFDFRDTSIEELTQILYDALMDVDKGKVENNGRLDNDKQV